MHGDYLEDKYDAFLSVISLYYPMRIPSVGIIMWMGYNTKNRRVTILLSTSSRALTAESKTQTSSYLINEKCFLILRTILATFGWRLWRWPRRLCLAGMATTAPQTVAIATHKITLRSCVAAASTPPNNNIFCSFLWTNAMKKMCKCSPHKLPEVEIYIYVCKIYSDFYKYGDSVWIYSGVQLVPETRANAWMCWANFLMLTR